ncbi:MAG: hypothetical protein M5T61_17670 [Acidimicrobiia bacterium]|nr:hypothetical protein [Acidimicrobiia bacterium]
MRITISQEEPAAVVVIEKHDQPTFDADPAPLPPGTPEARRIDTAFSPTRWGRSPFSGTFSRFPHQLESVYDESCSRGCSLLADDPGAGKTIMAGLYAHEPSSVRRRPTSDRRSGEPARWQWARELDERFQLTFQSMDAALFNSVPTENPWDIYPRLIVSRDFLRQEHVLDAFRSEKRCIGISRSLTRRTGTRRTSTGGGYLNKRRASATWPP